MGLVRDARRFIMYHRFAIERSPLQAYASALLFSPASSVVRGLFKEEEPKWLMIKPDIANKWSACLQTLEGQSNWVWSVALSRDSKRLASVSRDMTIKLWNISNGVCLQTFKGHSSSVNSITFNHDSTGLVSASDDSTLKIWYLSNGTCLQTLKGHSGWVNSVACSHDSTQLASASRDTTVKIWDTSSGQCLRTLGAERSKHNCCAFNAK